MVYVKFSVEIVGGKYDWKPRGESELSFEFPLESLGSIDAGNLFRSLLTIASVKYSEALTEEPKEE